MLNLASIARGEQKKWSDGGWVECVRHPTTGKPVANAALQPGAQAVARYWREGLGDSQRTGCSDFAWSAAFICWCLRQSGVALDQFPFSAGHHTYIRWAINNTKHEKLGKLFYGMRIDQYAPQPGDLIASWRKRRKTDPDPNITFDLQPDDFYPSHCDIVVASRPDRITAVGGNLGEAGQVKAVTLAATGGVLNAKKSLIAVLRLAGDA